MRRVVLPLLALAVFLPSMAFARTQFLCNVDLIVRDSCCCPPKKAAPPADVPTMKRECCKLEKHTAAAAPLATLARPRQLATPVAIAVAIANLAPRPPHLASTIVPRAQAPPPERSLFSQRCALLV